MERGERRLEAKRRDFGILDSIPYYKRTECEPSQLVAAEGIAVANAANKQCSTVSLSVNMAGGRMIGAAVQLVFNNNNELIAQQGEN